MADQDMQQSDGVSLARRRPIATLRDLDLESWTRGSLYQSSNISFGRALGLQRLGIGYSEVPPGKSGCPFHCHSAEDELFVILAGSGLYRFGSEEYAFEAGDVLAAPAGGPETAHQIKNTGREVLRYLSISANADAEIIQYPDSDKFQAKSRLPDGRVVKHIGRRPESVDYWSGEPGAAE
jgi:uncharacterized cupin superfamily protein